ncbi:MAG: hypothetical protein KC470_05745 [Dehalococcoidia bacterium]|nr:hypothetical protein [Dehalococcoidia bacterium]
MSAVPETAVETGVGLPVVNGASAGYPLRMSEIAFVDMYRKATLRKPQVGADAALRTMVTAAADDRLALLGVIGDYVVESALRLVAVYGALADRTHPVGRQLLEPLPGREAWDAFAQIAMTAEPSATIRDLSLGEDGLDPAERLRAMGDFGWVGPLITVTISGGLLAEGVQERGMVRARFALPGVATPVLDVREEDAATLADTMAEFSGIARGFLDAYVGARLHAGRVP